MEEEELVCSVCTEYFHIPVTISCGHTFCKECLRISTIERPQCPICRNMFLGNVDTLKQNKIIANLAQKYHKGKQPKANKPAQSSDLRQKDNQQKEQLPPIAGVQRKHFKNKLVVHTTARDLLMPFLRKRIVIRVQPELRNQLNDIIVIQNLPYLKYNIMGSMLRIEPSQSEIQCVGIFEGKQWVQRQQTRIVDCQIENSPAKIEVCSGWQLHEKTQLKAANFQYFFRLLERIPHSYLYHLAQNDFDPNIMARRDNPLALTYLALGILRLTDQHKYQTFVSFDDSKRLDTLEQFLSRYSVQDILRNPAVAFKIDVPGNYNSTFILIFIVVMLFFYSYEFGFEDL